MSNEKQIKKPSTMAFMLLPQFGQSFKTLSHIIPVFMRTLALMFAQAGLIPENHPATQYGAQGAEKTSFSRLMGEAWVTLRTQPRTTPYQWGLFVSVLMMLSLIIATIASFILSVGFGVGSVARAQLFTLSSGSTDMSSVAGAYTQAPGAYAFDKTIPSAGGHADYGIMLLDKIFRQGMLQDGGTLQNAMGTLFQVYNTGVLVIAGVMLFWAIVAVVVDTAKTGQIGGGRHNMVWAPIRIVFALGLLIPLGGVGFSSGQYMVLKLAEWGSNLASNGWHEYVQAVTGANKIVKSPKTANLTALINDYQKMWLCRVAYNAASIQASGPFPGASPHKINAVPLNSSGQLGQTSYAFTNERAGNLCGTLTMVDSSTLPSQGLANFLGIGGITNYATAMSAMNTYFDLSPSDTTIQDNAASFACDFVGRHVYGGPYGDPVIGTGNCPTGFAYGACQGGGTPGPQNWPPTNSTCFVDSVAAIGAGYQAAVNSFINGNGGTWPGLNVAANSAMLSDAAVRGWPSMGKWFLKIAEVNSQAESLIKPSITIKAGSLWRAPPGTSSAVGKVGEVMAKYEDWWKKVGVSGPSQTPVAAGNGGTGTQTQSNTAVVTGDNSSSDILSLTADSIWSFFFTDNSLFGQALFIDVVEPGNPDVYPLSELIFTGNMIFYTGLTFTTVTAMAPVVAIAVAGAAATGVGTIPFFGGGATPAMVATTGALGNIMEGPIGHLLITLGSTLMLCGGILKFWVPMVPFVRVAFSVLTWVISVFEAVAMVPIAALAHLHTEGDGISGGAKTAWILWLNVLLRPIVTVVAFVGVMMVFNGFVLYFHDGFVKSALMNTMAGAGAIIGFFSMTATTIIYVGMIYSVSNTVFKMLEIIPNGIMRWMGGSPDHSLDSHGDIQGLISAAGQQVSMASNKMMMGADRYDNKMAAAKAQPKQAPPGSGAAGGSGTSSTAGGGGWYSSST